MSRLPAIDYDTSATTTDFVPDWRDSAACRGKDPELFFPTPGAKSQLADAKRVCARCPVHRECGAWAIAEGLETGVWGGMDEDKRRELAGKPKPSKSLQPCGTNAALKRHERAGERCSTCRRAANERRAEATAAKAAESTTA